MLFEILISRLISPYVSTIHSDVKEISLLRIQQFSRQSSFSITSFPAWVLSFSFVSNEFNGQYLFLVLLCIIKHIDYNIDSVFTSDERNLEHWFYTLERAIFGMHGIVKYLTGAHSIQLPVNKYSEWTQEQVNFIELTVHLPVFIQPFQTIVIQTEITYLMNRWRICYPMVQMIIYPTKDDLTELSIRWAMIGKWYMNTYCHNKRNRMHLN